jgi:hypothetical protein
MRSAVKSSSEGVGWVSTKFNSFSFSQLKTPYFVSS